MLALIFGFIGGAAIVATFWEGSSQDARDRTRIFWEEHQAGPWYFVRNTEELPEALRGAGMIRGPQGAVAVRPGIRLFGAVELRADTIYNVVISGVTVENVDTVACIYPPPEAWEVLANLQRTALARLAFADSVVRVTNVRIDHVDHLLDGAREARDQYRRLLRVEQGALEDSARFRDSTAAERLRARLAPYYDLAESLATVP